MWYTSHLLYLNTVHFSLQFDFEGEKQVCERSEEELLRVVNVVQRLWHCMKCIEAAAEWNDAKQSVMSGALGICC